MKLTNSEIVFLDEILSQVYVEKNIQYNNCMVLQRSEHAEQLANKISEQIRSLSMMLHKLRQANQTSQ